MAHISLHPEIKVHHHRCPKFLGQIVCQWRRKKCIIIVVPNFLGNNREVNPDACTGAKNRVMMTELIRCFVTVICRWATIMFKIVICLKLHSHILESTKLLTLLKFHNTLAFQYLTTLATEFIVTDIVMTKIKRKQFLLETIWGCNVQKIG